MIAGQAAHNVASLVARPSKEKEQKKPAKPVKSERPPRPDKPETSASGKAGAGPKVPFPRKNQMPTEAEFLARLPAATGKRFDVVRTFLKKQRGISEDLFFYGPKTGWAFRYLRGPHSVATIMIHEERLIGIVALDSDAVATVDFASLSTIAGNARKSAHGSPSLLWLDLPLDGTGAADFKGLLKAKLKTLPAAVERGTPPPPPPPPPRGRSAT